MPNYASEQSNPGLESSFPRGPVSSTGQSSLVENNSTPAPNRSANPHISSARVQITATDCHTQITTLDLVLPSSVLLALLKYQSSAGTDTTLPDFTSSLPTPDSCEDTDSSDGIQQSRRKRRWSEVYANLHNNSDTITERSFKLACTNPPSYGSTTSTSTLASTTASRTRENGEPPEDGWDILDRVGVPNSDTGYGLSQYMGNVDEVDDAMDFTAPSQPLITPRESSISPPHSPTPLEWLKSACITSDDDDDDVELFRTPVPPQWSVDVHNIRPPELESQALVKTHILGTLHDLAVSNYKRNTLKHLSPSVSAISVDSPIYPPSVSRSVTVSSSFFNPRDGLPWTERALLKQFEHARRNRHFYPDSSSNISQDHDFDIWKVRDFYIFSPGKSDYGSQSWERRSQGLELKPLSSLLVKRGSGTLVLEGQVSLDGGTTWRYVSRLEFTILSVEGYSNQDCPIVETKNIYIQTERGSSRSRQIWLQLDGRPGKTYERYHWAFMWVATLGKYLVEFVDEVLDSDDGSGVQSDVGLSHFRSHFAAWLYATYGHTKQFQVWRACYGPTFGDDFRCAVVRHAGFLWKEACGVSLEVEEGKIPVPYKRGMSRTVFNISLWQDMLVLPGPIPVQPQVYNFTVVSDYVRHCFGASYFADLLGVVDSPDHVIAARQARIKGSGFLPIPHNYSISPTDEQLARRRVPITDIPIRRGDVVAIRPDEVSGWKNASSSQEPWLAYVQSIKMDRLYVIWLYQPRETLIGAAAYPLENELFLSDHCNCNDEPLHTSDVLFQTRVQFLVAPYKQQGRSTGVAWAESIMADKARFFVRQSYLTRKSAFQSFDRRSLRCPCKQAHKPKLDDPVDPTMGKSETRSAIRYREGECVLALVQKPVERLDPFVIDKVTDDDNILLRRLVRAGEVLPKAHSPNVLVWTDEVVKMARSSVVRRCDIRFFQVCEVVPPPYNLGGCGDCWVLSYARTENNDVEPLTQCPVLFSQGFDSTIPPPLGSLAGLSLFTGGGGLDRGLEAAHAVRTKWAVEWDRHAIHTTRVNAPVEESLSLDGSLPDKTGFWLGSIDDFVGASLSGKSIKNSDGTELVPLPGQVQFLSSGSPCQGFSLMQKFKMSESSRRNSSRVASTASALWLYLPDYFLIENVPNMVRMLGEGNIFGQLVSTAVGLGYQVQAFNVDAWSTGAPQSRCRVILACTAPGLTPMEPPTRTHSHPPNTSTTSLSVVAASGVPFGVRDFGPTPFPFVTASAATADLPPIQKGHLEICLKQPDHTLPFPQAPLLMARLAQVGLFPREQGLWSIYTANPSALPEPVRSRLRLQHPEGQNGGKVTDRSFSRLHPDKLFPTITTACNPMDRFTGQTIHWQEDRPLSMAEVKKAQGWSDHEVVLGSPLMQWKTLGNGVPRHIGGALGIQLRHAVEMNWRRLEEIKRTNETSRVTDH